MRLDSGPARGDDDGHERADGPAPGPPEPPPVRGGCGHDYDDRNLAVEYRGAEWQPERLPGLGAELVGQGVEVIVAMGGDVARAAIQATTTQALGITLPNEILLQVTEVIQ